MMNKRPPRWPAFVAASIFGMGIFVGMGIGSTSSLEERLQHRIDTDQNHQFIVGSSKASKRLWMLNQIQHTRDICYDLEHAVEKNARADVMEEALLDAMTREYAMLKVLKGLKP